LIHDKVTFVSSEGKSAARVRDSFRRRPSKPSNNSATTPKVGDGNGHTGRPGL
jgi:hypothetical protein